MKRLLRLLPLLLLAAPAAAGEKGGSAGAAFLRIGAGPRGVAMGEAFSAAAEGAQAVFWNPAALGGVKWRELFAGHQTWIEGVRLSHAAYAHGLSERTAVGVGFTHLSSGDLQGRDEFDAPTDTFDVSDWAAAVSAGRTFGRARAGLSLKAVQQAVGGEKGSAFAADAGLTYAVPFERQTVQWALVLKDFGTKIGPGRKADLPSEIRLGVADRLARESVVLAAEAVLPAEGDPQANAGAEFLLAGVFSLRAGYRFMRDDVSGIEGLTAGVGILYSKRQDYIFDYAFAGQGELGDVHRFGLTLRF